MDFDSLTYKSNSQFFSERHRLNRQLAVFDVVFGVEHESIKTIVIKLFARWLSLFSCLKGRNTRQLENNYGYVKKLIFGEGGGEKAYFTDCTKVGDTSQ